MDHERFDRLARRLATGADRRGILKGLVGGAAAVLAGGIARRPAAALHDEQCRHETGIFCSNTEPAPGHTCCAPNYVCSSATGNGTCQCAPHFIECGPADHASAGGNACIHESHCCTDGRPGCPDGQVCHADANGQFSCVVCQAAGQTCNQFHPCCHPEALVCSAAGTCVSREPECVPAGGECNAFHPCCHPEEFVCSSTSERPGTCERIPDERCGEKKVLCEAEGFKPKCCPVGHQCHQHEKSKTFDCRVAKNTNGTVRSQSRKRGRKRGGKR
jgi:hypothetical protein